MLLFRAQHVMVEPYLSKQWFCQDKLLSFQEVLKCPTKS